MIQTWNLVLADAQADNGGISGVPVGEEQETVTTTGVPADPNALGQTPKGKPSLMNYLPLVLIFVLMYFMLFRGPKKKQQQRNKMINALEKNDRVRTIGGIIGTVIDVKDDEVTIKIDESNNTKIKVVSSAIGVNMTKEKK